MQKVLCFHWFRSQRRYRGWFDLLAGVLQASLDRSSLRTLAVVVFWETDVSHWCKESFSLSVVVSCPFEVLFYELCHMAALVRDFFFFLVMVCLLLDFLAHVQALGLMFACKTLKILPEFSPRAPTLVLLDSKEAKVVVVVFFCWLSLVTHCWWPYDYTAPPPPNFHSIGQSFQGMKAVRQNEIKTCLTLHRFSQASDVVVWRLSN